jgi:predicted anti-sigma-YlaC factor YlaD
MKEVVTCSIVQDLLPNYIEKLTMNETNIFIEKHLETCVSCKEVVGYHGIYCSI